MTTIKRFEDLECWQEARKLVNMIYDAVRNSPEFQKYISKDTFQAIYDQALETIKIIDGLLRYLRSQLPSKRS